MAHQQQSDQEKEKMLTIALEESRRTFDHISNIFDQLRVKVLALIGGEVAIVTLLFTLGVPLPRTAYGIVFLSLGILFLCIAFGTLLWTISTSSWRIPVEMVEVKNLFSRYGSTIEFLEYVRDEYVDCIAKCVNHVGIRARRFNLAIYLLSAGVIILLVIKFGGMQL